MQGMTLTITFEEGGDVTMDVVGDLIGICGGSMTDGTDTGQFTATATHVTIDPGMPDEVTLAFSIQGNTMTLTGDIDGNPVTIVLSRA